MLRDCYLCDTTRGIASVYMRDQDGRFLIVGDRVKSARLAGDVTYVPHPQEKTPPE
jgi:hypothetical protein